VIDGGVVAERLETLLLARLSTLPKKGPAPTPDQLADGLRSYAPTTLDDRLWRDLVGNALQRLQDQQIVTPPPPRATTRRNGRPKENTHGARITGRRARKPPPRWVVRADELKRRIGPHTARDWKRWSTKLLPGLALADAPMDAKALKSLEDRNAWCAAIAARALRLWGDDRPPSFATLCNRLVGRELGLEGVPKNCPAMIRAHFLRTYIATEMTAPDQLVRQIAAQAIGALNVGLEAILVGLVQTWLTGHGIAELSARKHVPETTSSAPTPSPALLVEAVRSAAQHALNVVVGDRKVFISALWDAVRAKPLWTSLQLDDFKAQLVAAHRNQQLILARADFVAAMDPALVAMSETRAEGAMFHFVVREPAS
jgi:hypothetical protein